MNIRLRQPDRRSDCRKLIYILATAHSPSKCRYLPRGYLYTATAVEGWFLKMPSRWAARTSLCSISAANNTAWEESQCILYANYGNLVSLPPPR